MDLKDLSAYLTSLLRSDAEIIVAFFMGALVALVATFWLRRCVLPPHQDQLLKLARKELRLARRATELARAEGARKDAELARKEAEAAGFEARMALAEGRLREHESLTARLRGREVELAGQNGAMDAICLGLKAENDQLREAIQAAEEDAASLRTQLVHALDEARHWAKWYKKLEEENARFVESGSFQEG